MEQSTKRLPLWRKLGYGVGDFGANCCWTFSASFMLLYFTNVLGISAGIVGTLIMISKILDGFTDVFMGNIIDNTHKRMGKARFWLLVSTIPLAICTYLLFNVPASFNDGTKYAYIFIVYTLMGAVFYTMNNIAYSTLMALCSKDPRDRVQMGSFRYIFAILSGVVIQFATSDMVEMLGGGQQGWRMVSLIFSVLCFVILMVPILCVKELPDEELNENKQAKEKENSDLSFWTTLKLILKNKYFVLILLYYFFMYLFSFISSGLGIYYTTYCLGKPSVLGSIGLCSYIPTIIVLTMVDKITGRFGIRRSAFFGHCIALAGTIVALFGGLANAVPMLLAGLFIRGLGMAPMSGSVNALIAATDDYSELTIGRRMTGAFFSCSSVGIKVGTGVGTAVCGFLLDLGKYDGTLLEQAASTVAVIKWSYLLPNVLFPVATLIILSFLDVEETTKKLRAKAETHITDAG